MSVVAPPSSPPSSSPSSCYPRPPMRSLSELSPVSSATDESFARVLDAVKPFVESIQSSWPSAAVIRLHVTVPTSPTVHRDLKDVHALQTNLFGFLHHVVQGLRKKGIWATYHLSFSLASVQQVLLASSKFDASDASSTLNATLLEVENVPALVIS